MTAFRKKFADAKSLNYANPSNHAHTFRVVNDTGTKSVKGVTALNNRLECISSSQGSITEGDRTVEELLAVRVQLSGSVKNSALLQKRWAEMKANVDAAIVDGALTGFLPTNAEFIVVE